MRPKSKHYNTNTPLGATGAAICGLVGILAAQVRARRFFIKKATLKKQTQLIGEKLEVKVINFDYMIDLITHVLLILIAE
jgi:hypothetical protein